MGISILDSDDIIVRNSKVHHCPGSGVRADRSDNININNNLIFGNAWWTTSAQSALVIAEAKGSGKINIGNNVVYGNRNFMPFFKTYMPTGGHQVNSTYG